MTDPWEWYIYLLGWLIFMVNVGIYTIHGSYGAIQINQPSCVTVFFAVLRLKIPLRHSLPSIFAHGSLLLFGQNRGTQHVSPCRLWKCTNIALWEGTRWTMCQDFCFEPIEAEAHRLEYKKNTIFDANNWWEQKGWRAMGTVRETNNKEISPTRDWSRLETLTRNVEITDMKYHELYDISFMTWVKLSFYRYILVYQEIYFHGFFDSIT